MIKKNYTIFLFILILIFLSINQKLNIIPSLRFSNIENLQDYGSKTQAFSGGPLPYSSFVDYLKEPEDIKNKKLRIHFKKITKNIQENRPFTSKKFNKKKNKIYYDDEIMETDFKYFNNASNLRLYQYFNR